MNKFYIILMVLVLYTLVIFLPPIVHGYVYPNNGDDSAFHMAYFDRIKNGEELLPNYLGQNIVGYPLVWISEITGASTDVLFLWFNYLVLWLVGMLGFALIAKFVDWRAGLLALPMVAFMTPSTLNLFDTGAVYDLATIGVMFPLVLFCGMQLWVSRKWWWSVPLALAAAMVMGVHTMAIWEAMKLRSAASEVAIPTLVEFMEILVGYMVVMMFVVALAVIVYKRRSLAAVDGRVKALTVGLMGVSAVLLLLVFTGVIGWSLRIAVNLAIMFPLLAACLWGIVIKITNGKLVLSGLCLFVVMGSIPCLWQYVQYNSAVKLVDMEAIEYVNSLHGEYYSCSPEVAPWIYGRYLNKEYKEGELPYIGRSEPMTSRTTPTALGYWREGRESPHPLYWIGDEVKTCKEHSFSDGGLVIHVLY